MKKLGLTILVILVVAVAGLAFSAGSIIKNGVNSFGPDIVGSKVSLEDASVSIFTGEASLTGLVVGNPEGFNSDHAFRLGKVSIDLEVNSLFSNTVVIKEISILEPEITYEIGLGGTNIGAIQSNVSKGSSEQTSDEDAGDSKEGGKKVVIEDLYINGAQVMPSIAGAGVPVPLPTIHIEDFGKDSGGSSFGEAIETVLNVLLESLAQLDLSALTEGVGETIEAVGESIEEVSKELGPAGEVLGEGVEATTDAIGEGVKGAGEAVEEGLKGATEALDKLF